MPADREEPIFRLIQPIFWTSPLFPFIGIHRGKVENDGPDNLFHFIPHG